MGAIHPRAMAALAMAALLSCALNVFHLAVPIYSMQVFNRVLPGASHATLLWLSVLTAAFVAAAFVLDGARSAILIRLATRLDPTLHDLGAERALLRPGDSSALRDAEAVRSFLCSPLAAAALDAPWSVFFLAAIFWIDWRLGCLAVAALATCAATAWGAWAAGVAARARAASALKHGAASLAAAWESRDAQLAMGQAPLSLAAMAVARRHYTFAAGVAAERQAWIEAAGRAARQLVLTLSLAVAAVLVLASEIAPGALIAVSLLFARATGAFERLSYGAAGAGAAWRAVVGAHGAATAVLPQVGVQAALEPDGDVAAEHVVVRVAGRAAPLLGPVSLRVAAGSVALVQGPDGAGKSTLVRVLAGALRPTAGTVRLGGYLREALPPTAVRRAVGFLPETVELGAGSVAEIIARGDVTAARDDVLRAAVLAGAHGAVQRLPLGYDTRLGGPDGPALSGGERRRIGLARACYGRPALVVLDEPTSGLDENGADDVVRTVSALARGGATVIIVSRHAALAAIADRLIVLEGGRIARDGGVEALNALGRPHVASVSRAIPA